MFHEFRIAVDRLADEHDRAMSLAWHIAALERQKKLPELETLMSRRGQPRRQSSEQQRAMLRTLSGQYGGQVRKTRMIKLEARG